MCLSVPSVGVDLKARKLNLSLFIVYLVSKQSVDGCFSFYIGELLV